MPRDGGPPTATPYPPAAPPRRTARRVSQVPDDQQTRVGSFDHLIGAQQEGGWDREAEGLGRLEIDDKVELLRPLDGQFSRSCALQDPSDIPTAAAKCLAQAR